MIVVHILVLGRVVAAVSISIGCWGLADSVCIALFTTMGVSYIRAGISIPRTASLFIGFLVQASLVFFHFSLNDLADLNKLIMYMVVFFGAGLPRLIVLSPC
jgi:hypothetical protein